MGNVHINTKVPVVLSMTTVPWRLQHTLKVVKKLLSELDGFTYLIINIPKKYRNGWDIDESIINKFPNDPRLIVARTEDYGPATKFLPVLNFYPQGTQAILIIMDDSEYHLSMIKKIAEAQEKDPKHAHTFYTYKYKDLNVPQGVDLIGLWWPSISGLGDYWQKHSGNDSCWRVDDLVLAGYLKQNGIPIHTLSRENLKWVWKPIPKDQEGETLFGKKGEESRERSMEQCWRDL